MRKEGLGQNGIVCVQLALNSTGVNGTGPPTRGFFSTCSQPAVGPGFCIHEVSQLQIENGIFDPQLGLSGRGGPTVCTVLSHFI